MYIPQNSQKFQDNPQIRLLLVGAPGSGKTFNVVNSFPNIVYADFDNGLTDKRLREYGPVVIPFYDKDWCKGDQALTFKKWLNTEGHKLEAGQTLFIDSITGLQAAIHVYYEAQTPASPKTGEPDGFYLWKMKEAYLRDVHIILKSLKCHVVCAMHSKEERDKNDCLLGKITPYMTGGFKEQLCSHYTHVFRAYVEKDKYLWQVVKDGNHDYIKSRGQFTSNSISASYQNLL